MPWLSRAKCARLDKEGAEVRHHRDRLEGENAVLRERIRANEHSQLSQQAANLTAIIEHLFKLKMAGAILLPEPPVKRTVPNPVSDEQIALQRADDEFIESYVWALLAKNKDIDPATVREEARRIRLETRHGVPG